MMKISVIIPTWNRSKEVVNAVRSVQNQTYDNIEILVCDDGSTDDTKDIINSISKDDKRIKFIEGVRGGCPAIPRNRGIEYATGDWLAFLDSDDEWLPSKIEIQLGHLYNNDTKASCTNAYRKVPGIADLETLLNYGENSITFENFLDVNNVICSSAIIHRSIFDLGLRFSEDNKFKAIEDYALWLKISSITNFVYINKNLVIYNDDIVNSVRGEENKKFHLQKKIVLKEFLNWSYKNDEIVCIRNKRLHVKRQILKDNINMCKRMLKKIVIPKRFA